MNILMVILRFVHVSAGVFWGGGALFMEFFVSPTIAATHEAGQAFAQHLSNKIRLHVFMSIAAGSTVLAGALLYWIDSDGFSSAWMKSGAGIGFGIGAVFGLVAFVFGFIFGRSTARLGEIGAQIKGKPTSEQITEIQAIQKRMKMVSPYHKIAMILAIVFMGTSRYLVF
jgi:uncharacterized membrane protein